MRPLLKYSPTSSYEIPRARAGQVPRRKGSDYMDKIRHEPRDVSALKIQLKDMTPVQLAQTVALLNMAAAIFAGYASITAASEQKQA